jgi:N-acetylneuraminic acid mutarotase
VIHPDLIRKQKRNILISFLVAAALVGGLLFLARKMIQQPYTTRSNIAAAAVGREIYVFGGLSLTTQGITDEILEINPSQRTIRVVAHLPFPRSSFCAVALENQIFTFGGLHREGYCDEIVSFNPESRNVRIAGHLPSPRGFGAAAAIFGKFYYIGGWDGNQCLDEIVMIDPSTGSAEIVARLLTPIEYLTVSVHEGLLLVIGGEDSTGTLVDEIIAFDPKTREVTSLGQFPFPRARTAATAVGEDIFLFGGWDLGLLNELICVNVTDRGAIAKIVGRLPSPMADRVALTMNGKMYLLGGISSHSARQLGILELDPVTKSINEVKL